MIQNIYPLGGPAATVCGATVKTNAIVVPRPEAHRPAHSLQTTCKPPRSDNIRKRNGRSERKPAPHSLRAERQQYRSAPETDFASACLSRTRAPVAPNTRLYPTQPHLCPQLCIVRPPLPFFYRIFSYICFNRIAPATTDRAAARRPLSVFHRIYFVYLFIEPRKDGLRSKPETHAISVSKARTDL